MLVRFVKEAVDYLGSQEPLAGLTWAGIWGLPESSLFSLQNSRHVLNRHVKAGGPRGKTVVTSDVLLLLLYPENKMV